MAHHHHQAKRPYNGSQPSITSYFSSTGTYTSSPSTQTIYPEPPATIQANLLSVGMRVRKSVPEGYKTNSQYSGFALFSDPSTSLPESDSPGASPKTKGTRPRARELTPFCGILKVGGMAEQGWGSSKPDEQWREFVNGEEEDDDECPFLSQGSTVSSSSSFGTSTKNYPIFGQLNPGNKRRFDEEEDEVMAQTPRSGDRILAVPRRKKGDVDTKSGAGRVPVFGLGQENHNGDFEEAEFLDYGLVGEVEMGGV